MQDTSFTHILCGVDGSDAACRAASVAANLAKAYDATLTYVTVAKEAADSPELAAYRRNEEVDPGILVPIVNEDAEACLKTALDIAGQAGIETANRVVRTGDVVEAILSLGTELGADALVLGHHSRSKVGRALVAPVSTKVADRGSMKVLLVP